MTHIACLDVDYRAETARAACVAFPAWDAAEPSRVVTATLPAFADYEPGAFYKRELPALLAVIDAARQDFDAIIVDGYVWLDNVGRPGLGARLHEALSRRVPIVGVAKTPLRGDTWSVRLLRGASRRPLLVTAAGMEAQAAADAVRAMHGEHRIPTMVRLADAACRAP